MMFNLFSIVLPLVPLAAVVLFRYVQRRSSSHRNLPLPPGPKPRPVVGNLFDLPSRSQWPWRKCKELADVYGDIVHLRVFGRSVIYINSAKAANELFEQHSAITSDRPIARMVNWTGWGDWNFGAMQYGPEWRAHRRVFHRYFQIEAVKRYKPVQESRAQKYVRQLYDRPHDVVRLNRHLFGGIILESTYGFDVKDSHDPYVELSEEALEGFVESCAPNRLWLGFVPFLRHIPTWVPGTTFQRQVARWKALAHDVRELPWKVAHDALKDNTAFTSQSIIAQMWEDLPATDSDKLAEEERIAKNIAGIAYASGAHTTFGTMQVFYLAMTLYPEVQKRAQAELDAIVGPSRLPNFDDRPSLVYLEALMKECLRWQLVIPLVPHKTSEDDTYNGYFIPKGSIIFANSWAIMHDPEAYPDPEEFKPERFIKDGALYPSVRDPNIAVFGYGRRICPGRHFSSNSFFIAVASVLHVFSITPPLDKSGKPAPPPPEMTPGFASYPADFQCVIKPRSSAAEALITKLDF